jgi:HAD superfamily phosphoserine phosphatase-like hydrolase
VDDGSIDGTPERALAAGATVITSTFLGKGASMEDGMRAARQRIILYLDGDLQGLDPNLVERMTRPILKRSADMVKARFTRQAGRVTTLTARPLLRTFFPELAGIDQPLAGIMAARRSLLRKLRFEDDYGVDVGLLIDAVRSGARIVEADIGHLQHDSQSLDVLGDMATQVARTILARASEHGRLRMRFLKEVQEVERQTQNELAVALAHAGVAKRLALFDMDGVLVRGRFIVELAHRTGQGAALAEFLDNWDMDPEERTRRIAGLFAGVPLAEFQQAARGMTLMPGARETAVTLRKNGYRVGIVTDGFRMAAEIVRRRIFADFSVAQQTMRFQNTRATGQVTLSPAMCHDDGCATHRRCKVNVMHHLLQKMGITPQDVVAVGDGENDICLLRAAGKGIAFRPKSASVRAAARHVVEGALSDILPLLGLGDHALTNGAVIAG